VWWIGLKITFITDPLVTTAGAVRPSLLLAKEFTKNGYEVTFAAPEIYQEIEEILRKEGFGCRRVGSDFPFIPSIPTFDAWARQLIQQKTIKRISDAELVVNTSSCIIAPANAYYAQGPMTRTLRDISRNMPAHYQCVHKLFARPFDVLENRLVKKFKDSSKVFVANSAFCASMYEDLDVSVDIIIYPPLDCTLFRPSTENPSADYVLTHLGIYGKEGDFRIVKAIADAGVHMKVFGRTTFAPGFLRNHKNLDFLGRVSDRELVELYSNALYTLFAFSHEPFGYIPVESNACGTPVVTYDKQGPCETVVNMKTGWQEHTDQQLVRRALNLWKNKYPSRLRTECRNRALMFDAPKIAKKWFTLLNGQKISERS
jgi:glycosyltransferase involved in cell wall biosynthesis